MTAGGVEIAVFADESALADAAAERLISALAGAQAAGRVASVVLTGGGIGIKLLTAVAGSPARPTVDWHRVDVWWGDERFVPAADPERNEAAARAALLDHVDVDPARVHAMGSSDAYATAEHAAAAYAQELAVAADDGLVPLFDVLLLGIGPEGHVASLFPQHPAMRATGPVVAVHECPKPPPNRISLSFQAIESAREVWLVASGRGKAEAIAAALSGADRADVPAAGARGSAHTAVLVDAAAAAALPTSRGAC